MYPRDKKELAECILAILYGLTCIVLLIVSGALEIKDIVENTRYNHALKKYREEVTIYNEKDRCAYLTPGSDYFYAVGYLYEDEILGVVIRDTMEILQYSGVPYDKFVSFYYDNAEEWMQEYYEYDIADIYECENLGVLEP